MCITFKWCLHFLLFPIENKIIYIVQQLNRAIDNYCVSIIFYWVIPNIIDFLVKIVQIVIFQQTRYFIIKYPE